MLSVEDYKQPLFWFKGIDSIQSWMGKVTSNYLRIRFDHIVHDKFFKEGLCGAVRGEILVLLLFPLFAPFLPFFPLLRDLSFLPLVSFNCLERNMFVQNINLYQFRQLIIANF